MILSLALVVLAAEPATPQPPPEGRFIVDLTGAISPRAKGDVDELALTVHAGGFGELAVLVVDSTAGVAAAKYATKVFSTWPVGHAENVDGALLFVALKDKTCALVLGDGYVGVSTKDLEASVVALVKEAKPDEAVREGSLAVLRLLEGYKKTGAGPAAAKAPDAGAAKKK